MNANNNINLIIIISLYNPIYIFILFIHNYLFCPSLISELVIHSHIYMNKG